MPQEKRIEALDGVRGAAAVSVAIFHFFSGFVPRLVPDRVTNPYWVADTPLNLFCNGPFAVALFFVLSGFVIANSAAGRPRPLISNVVFRYLRLAVPAGVSIIFAWILLSLFPHEVQEMLKLSNNHWLLDTYQDPVPGFFTALYEGFIGNFYTGRSDFNSVVWTMKIELIGSCIVYFLYAISGDRFRIPVLFVFAALTAELPMSYEGFVLGAFIRELYIRNWYAPILSLPFFVLGLLLGFEGTGFTDRVSLPVKILPGWISSVHMLRLGQSNGLMFILAAALIIYGVVGSPFLKKALATRALAFLGRISFGLYLIHVPLVYTIFAWVYLTFRPLGPTAMIAFFIVYIFVCLSGAYIFTRAVDEPVLQFIGRMRKSAFVRPVSLKGRGRKISARA